MPITFHMNQDAKLMVSKYTKDIDDTEFIECYRSILNDDAYKLGTDELVDLSEVNNCDFTMEGLRGVHALMYKAYETSTFYKRTAIVTTEPKYKALVTMYRTLDGEHTLEDVASFSTTSDALRWLKKDSDILQNLEEWQAVAV